MVTPAAAAVVAYQPNPADAKRVAEAKVFFVNGLNFEGWLDRFIKASGTKAKVVVTSKDVRTLQGTPPEGDAHKGHTGADPHAWQSIPNAKIYIGNIRDALIAADPVGKDVNEANAAAYLTDLEQTERYVTDTLAAIPAERRRIITSHEAFAYFGDTYGISLIAPQGVSTESEASARAVGRIVNQIKREKIPAVFLENVTDQRLVKRIAAETGAKVGGSLYSDALSASSGPAPTYIAMMRHNASAIAQALR
jgi:zinc/manganese transport system substrate-binding protein